MRTKNHQSTTIVMFLYFLPSPPISVYVVALTTIMHTEWSSIFFTHFKI